MKIVKPTVELVLLAEPEFIMQHIEATARTCYKSYSKMTSTSYNDFIRMLVRNGHEAMLEHGFVTANLRVDRAIANELVRHRLAAYAQESTRYCNYKSDDIEFIQPVWYADDESTTVERRKLWAKSCKQSENYYKKLLELGASPQEARNVLTHSLATTICVTANLREWRHILKLRCDKAAHPQMRRTMLVLLRALYYLFSPVFEDLYNKYKDEIDELSEPNIMYYLPDTAQEEQK